MSEKATIVPCEPHISYVQAIHPKKDKIAQSSPRSLFVTDNLQSPILGRVADKKTPQVLLMPNLSRSSRRQPRSINLPRGPVLPENHVSRPRLLEKLSAHDNILTQFIAPAGYGKSTLVAEWMKDSGHRHIWLLLENSDDLPLRFWQRFAQAVDVLLPGAGIAALQMLAASLPPTIESIVASLGQDVCRVAATRYKKGRIFLVIDNFHCIANLEIHQQLFDFLKQVSPQLRLIILSRRELSFDGDASTLLAPLVLRYSDLAFTAAETLEYFQKSTSQPATLANALEITRFFEGWVAGLQLIASKAEMHPKALCELLFLKDRVPLIPDLMRQTFDETPHQQQIFMLCTAIFSEFTPEMTDWICMEEFKALLFTEEQSEISMMQPMCKDSREIIASLQQSGCFIYSCAGEVERFRYHPLFAEMLRVEFRKRFPERERTLRDRSQLWYLRHSTSIGK